MTEDDTFNALRRPSYETVINIRTRFYKIESNLLKDFDYEAYHWRRNKKRCGYK